MKALIIGLDGATWDVFDDYLLENHMPNLNKLKKGGYWGVLRSTHPPITSAAWTTCITGCQPYKHGIVGFREYSFASNNLSASSAASCCVPTIWEELSKQGYKVASVNVPWTYPCRKVNGAMVAGYGVPGMGVEFTYPSDLSKELLAKMPDYEVLADWEQVQNYDAQLLERNVSKMEHRFDQRVEAAQLVFNRFSPDVMMVQFQNTDLVQHMVFDFVSRHTRDRYPQQRDRLFRMFKKLDDSIGSILQMSGGGNCNVVVVSDHGLCKLRGKIRANALLYKWGYLKPKPPLARMIRRLRRNLQKFGIWKNTEMALELKAPIDWKKSKAMLVYPAHLGYIYLNVKGRNKDGYVNPGAEYHQIINDLKKKFSSMSDPVTKEPVFEFVGTPAELYGVDNPDPELVGDLVLVPMTGYIVHQTASRKAEPIKLMNDDSVEGTHCYGGIYIFHGPDIRQCNGQQHHIVDIAPTLMTMLGAEIGAYVDGKVIESAFSVKKVAKYQSVSEQAPVQKGQKRLSKDEDDEITRRLSALGYMD
jgi:predicted AlkP superfamily phosphohydrolase/phosphomutase